MERNHRVIETSVSVTRCSGVTEDDCVVPVSNQVSLESDAQWSLINPDDMMKRRELSFCMKKSTSVDAKTPSSPSVGNEQNPVPAAKLSAAVVKKRSPIVTPSVAQRLLVAVNNGVNKQRLATAVKPNVESRRLPLTAGSKVDEKKPTVSGGTVRKLTSVVVPIKKQSPTVASNGNAKNVKSVFVNNLRPIAVKGVMMKNPLSTVMASGTCATKSTARPKAFQSRKPLPAVVVSVKPAVKANVKNPVPTKTVNVKKPLPVVVMNVDVKKPLPIAARNHDVKKSFPVLGKKVVAKGKLDIKKPVAVAPSKMQLLTQAESDVLKHKPSTLSDQQWPSKLTVDKNTAVISEQLIITLPQPDYPHECRIEPETTSAPESDRLMCRSAGLFVELENVSPPPGFYWSSGSSRSSNDSPHIDVRDSHAEKTNDFPALQENGSNCYSDCNFTSEQLLENISEPECIIFDSDDDIGVKNQNKTSEE